MPAGDGARGGGRRGHGSGLGKTRPPGPPGDCPGHSPPRRVLLQRLGGKIGLRGELISSGGEHPRPVSRVLVRAAEARCV